MIRIIHGLEVQPAAIPLAAACFSPNYDVRQGNTVFTFEGDLAGFAIYHLGRGQWYPADCEGPWPLDADGDPINTTFGTTEEHEAEMVFFDRLEDAVCFLAVRWNRDNPSQAVRMEVAA